MEQLYWSSLPAQGLKHLKATAIQVMMASKPVKILAVYLSPSRPDCFGPVFLPWRRSYRPLNAKHVDWNSRLITRDRLWRDYADKNSCLIYGSSTPTTVPYNSSATPDVLDIAIIKDLVTHVSDHVLRTEFRSLNYTN